MVRDGYALGDAGVELDVVRQISSISETGTKPAPVNSVEAEHPSAPVVNHAGGIGEGLVVIEENIVSIDECQFRRTEIELPRLDLRALRDAPCKVLVGVDIVVGV